MDKAVAANLDNAVLAHLLLRIVWQGYDAGGISAGRSLRAFLLESAIEFLPEAKYDFGPGDYPVAEAEAENRLANGWPPVQMMLFPGRGRIDRLMDGQFAQVLLAEIQRWYRSQRDEPVFYRRDVQLVALAQRLLPHNLRLAKYSRATVIDETKERLWVLRGRAMERWDNERILRDRELLARVNE